ncbi:MAG TPA: potassium channel family protein [Jiangellaceae bacterium]|nr:potassium channel family protein [Jiangellaceae bacterium]
MAGTVASDLESRRHRRLIVAGLFRASLTTVVLVALYYVLPFDEPLQMSAVVRLIVSLIIFSGVVIWQIRSILRSRYPGIRAAVALAVAAPLFLLIFASTYFLMSGGGSGNFSQTMTRTDALYFTVTTFATVGFGDITATSQLARSIVTVQMILDLLILGLGIRALLGVVRLGRERQAAAKDEAGPVTS